MESSQTLKNEHAGHPGRITGHARRVSISELTSVGAVRGTFDTFGWKKQSVSEKFLQMEETYYSR